MSTKASIADLCSLAARHGLHVSSPMTLNEMGLDFQVGFVTDTAGQRWVLRIPRRADVLPKVEQETRILDFVKGRLPVKVPNWQVCSSELIAYPLLPDPIALVFDAETHVVTRNIADEANYVASLAAVLVALHASSVAEASAAGIPVNSPEEVRNKARRDIDCVKHQLGIGRDLETRYHRWLDADRLWPDHSVLTHGDLYAGHVTVAADGRVSGVIDWTEAEVNDPAIDFAGHLAAFSPESLVELVTTYDRAGGRTWPGMIEHITERHAASPIKYGVFALITGNEQHLAAAKSLLAVE